jgi:uncharacterized tellurite resistance protein B-like protein
MLDKIKTFFDTFFSTTDNVASSIEHQLNLAAAALLLEMSAQDQQVSDQEITTVRQALLAHLDVSEHELDELYQLGQEEKQQATDYHQFTRLIAEHYEQDKKVHLVELLWRVAFADSELDKYEEQMVRKICDLIYVSHKDYLQTKHRVMKELGLE